jgi:hypothetical protein
MSSPHVQSATLKPKPEPAELGGSQALPFLGTAVGQLDALAPPAPEAPPAPGPVSLLPPHAKVPTNSPRQSLLLARTLEAYLIGSEQPLILCRVGDGRAPVSAQRLRVAGSWFAYRAGQTPKKGTSRLWHDECSLSVEP